MQVQVGSPATPVRPAGREPRTSRPCWTGRSQGRAGWSSPSRLFLIKLFSPQILQKISGILLVKQLCFLQNSSHYWLGLKGSGEYLVVRMFSQGRVQDTRNPSPAASPAWSGSGRGSPRWSPSPPRWPTPWWASPNCRAGRWALTSWSQTILLINWSMWWSWQPPLSMRDSFHVWSEGLCRGWEYENWATKFGTFSESELYSTFLPFDPP